MKSLLTPFLLAVCVFAASAAAHAADFPDNFLSGRQGFEWNRYALNGVSRPDGGKLLRRCLTDCAREQGACTEQCSGSGPCAATCDAAHSRCVEGCNALPR